MACETRGRQARSETSTGLFCLLQDFPTSEKGNQAYGSALRLISAKRLTRKMVAGVKGGVYKIRGPLIGLSWLGGPFCNVSNRIEATPRAAQGSLRFGS